MKKIALVVPNYEKSGGVKTVANFIKSALLEKGYKIQVFSLAVSFQDGESKLLTSPKSWLKNSLLGSNENHIVKVGANFPELETNRYLPRKELTNALNEFDIIQIVAGTPAWAYVCKNVESPIALQVATLTAVEREEKSKRAYGLIGRWKNLMTKKVSQLDYLGLKLVDAIMVENFWMKKLLNEKGYSKKTYFAPPGVDTSIFKPPTKTFKPLLKQPYILSVGRFSDPRKDVRTLIKAYKKLKNNQNNIPKLVLAGKKMPRKKDITLAKSLGICDDMIFLENVSFEKLIKLYQGANVFALSSREEGLGMVIMEAMACGTPVVSTDCGGPRTLIEHGYNGFLTGVGNPQDMADKLLDILNNKDLNQKFVKRSLKKISDNFSLSQAIDKYTQVYQGL